MTIKKEPQLAGECEAMPHAQAEQNHADVTVKSANSTMLELQSKDGHMKRFVELLSATNRKGIADVIYQLNKWGFFEAPASSVFHLNRRGGLLEHSLNVYDMAMMLREQMITRSPKIESLLPENSVVISSLLHDVCKAEIYKTTIRSRKNEDGNWKKYQGYEVNCSAFPLGHGEKSVIQLLRWGLTMSDDEIMAIRWHMTAWDLPFQSPELKNNLSKAREICPLCIIIQCADSLASGIIETL